MINLVSMNESREASRWSVFQRLLAFDDPFSRWSKLNKTTANLESLEASSINRLFQAVLAFDDVRVFTEIAFLRWMTAKKRVQETNMYEHLLVGDSTLKPAQRSWIAEQIAKPLNWYQLREPQFWQLDSRFHFISDCLEAISTALADIAEPLSVSTIEQAHGICLELRHNWSGPIKAPIFPRALAIVEGASELTVLPHFARVLKVDLDKRSAILLNAGGANQVLRRYLHWRELTQLSIVCLLDGDATAQAELLSDNLRACDCLIQLEHGELEDALSQKILHATFNSYLMENLHDTAISPASFEGDAPKNEVMRRLCRQLRLPEFDKIAFAKQVVENVKSPEDVPPQLKEVINKIAVACGEPENH